jgi:signal transduction histidine kinase
LLAIQAMDVRSALDQASDLVATALGADKVDVFLYEARSDTLVALGTSDTPMGRKQQALGLDRLPLSNRGKTVEVFQTGQPYDSGHLEADPGELPGIKEGLGVRSVLVVPLEVEGTRRGAIQVDAQQPEQFTEEDLAFLQAVAQWVGLLLHRAELAERVAHEASEQARQRTAIELITMLAHDLRAPLVPLLGYLTMIQRVAEREGQDRYVEYATRGQRSVQRLERMLNDLLDTTRLDQGIFVLTLEPVNLVALVQETAELMRSPTAPIEVRGSGELVAAADAERLRQVLENLLSNARRYGPEGMPVIVEVTTERSEESTWAVISVQDAGPGIALEVLPRLFTRFTSGGDRRGLGLGLYLARGIAEAHGGMLTVDSTLGKGASFRLALPLSNLDP